MQYWMEYSLYGGYPKVVLAKDFADKQEWLKELVFSFLKKDVYELGVREKDKFYKLVRILASQTGQLLNTNELSNTLQLAKDTVSRYLHVLQKSFIIRVSPPFYRNLRKELTKMPKVYFLDPGYRNQLLNIFGDLSHRPDAGATFENLIFSELVKSGVDDIKYWRTQDRNEIDLIVDQRNAYEVKINAAAFSPTKYKTFNTSYPEMDLRPIVLNDEKMLDVLDVTS